MVVAVQLRQKDDHDLSAAAHLRVSRVLRSLSIAHHAHETRASSVMELIPRD